MCQDFQPLNRIVLSQAALDNNVRVLREAAGEIFPVIKANAYGHGIQQIATMLQKHELPYLVVASYYEALDVKKVSAHQEVLVLGSIDAANAHMLDADFTYALYSLEFVKALGRTNRNFKVHIEIDTGMSRHGVRPDELPELIDILQSYDNLTVTGVMSHLADADNAHDSSFTDSQTTIFDNAVEQLQNAGITPQWIHLAQSAGLAKVHSKYSNAARPGIALYGVIDLEPSDPAYDALAATQPVMSLYSRIGVLRHLTKGDKVSYGLRYEAPRDMTIGVLNMGYADFLPRDLSGLLTFRYQDHELPQIGRICMNHCMFDTNGLDLRLSDEIELISSDRTAPNSIQSMRSLGSLFAYEFLVHINPEIERRIVD